METKEKRQAISISLTKHEKVMLQEKASAYGLSLSAFLRLAAMEYIKNRKKDNESGITDLSIKNK